MKMYYILVLVSFSLHPSSSFHVTGSQCRDVSGTVCTELGYTLARFPNGLGHRSVDHARAEFYRFQPLLKLNCSKSLTEFLCTVYFPECNDEKKDHLVLTHRDLCEDSYRGCRPLLLTYGYDWPKNLNCMKFQGNNVTSNYMSSRRKPLNIPFKFDVSEPSYRLFVQFTSDSITFPSCCQIFHFIGKEISLSKEVDLIANTADLRNAPEITIERMYSGPTNLQGKYLSLVMVNYYMKSISHTTLAVHWMVINIVDGDFNTGLTKQEYKTPKPSIETCDTYHFLLFEHRRPLDVFSKELFRQNDNIVFLGEKDESQLVTSVKLKVSIDEYVRFREVTEMGFPEEEVCSDIKDYTVGCTGRETNNS